MGLTEKQINAIHKLDSDTLLEVLQECAEALGLVSIDEYCEIMYIKKRNLYYKLENNYIKYFEIGGHKYPIINETS